MPHTFIEGWESGIDGWTEQGEAGFSAPSTDFAFGCLNSLRTEAPAGGTLSSVLTRTGLPGSGMQDVTYYLSNAIWLPTGFWASLGGDTLYAPGFVSNNDGALSYVVLDSSTQQLVLFGNPSVLLVEGQWYFFELAFRINSADDSLDFDAWLDSVSFASGNTGAGQFAPGETIVGMFAGTASNATVAGAFYYIDTYEWSQTGQIGQVLASDETCVSGTAGRFLSSPPWRWVVTELDSQVVTFLDHLAMDRQVVHLLNRPSTQQCRLPSDNPEVNILQSVGTGPAEPFVSEGTKLLYCFRREGGTPKWRIRASGIILQLEDEADSADASTAYTHLTSYDPWQYLYNRPVVNIDGDLPGPNGLSFGATTGDEIALQLIRNTIINHGSVHLDVPLLYGGTFFWGGTRETTTAMDINFEQGTSVGEALEQLAETDTIDFEIEPIWDPINRPGYTSQLSIWTEMGSTQFSSIFAWDRPSHSLVGISRLKDGTQRANNVKFFAGPGGQDGEAVLETDAQSVAKYGEYWAQQFFPKQTILQPVQALAAAQLALRKNGKTTLSFSPAPERAPMLYTEYFLGDRVPVYASRNFREELGGPAADPLLQRIYGIPIRITDDGVEEVQRMITAVQS